MEIKGITPVIALVMLLLVTVGLVAISYVWFNSVISGSVSKAVSIPAGGAYCSGGKIQAYVLNIGDTDISAPDIAVADVDGVSVINNGLVGWWRFDEGAGLTAADSSGFGNTGTLTNMDTNDWVPGRSGNALDFDGVNDMVSIPNFGSTAPNREITLTAWANLRPFTVGTQRDFISLFDGNNRINVHMPWDGNAIWQYGNPIDGCSIDITSIITAGTWHFFAFTANNNTGTSAINIDGIERCTGPANAFTQVAKPLMIGGRSSNPFSGIIDEVKIYNRALLPAEIKFLYGIKTGDSALVVDYPATAGRHNVRIGTSSTIVETGVICQ
ncbi:MAG: LamG domain-containing protein [Candidatus Aenigmarchaeota archaeon]|nr:LamG domain-containing protein [Candidatus Aenigmarchaeota archaeon]